MNPVRARANRFLEPIEALARAQGLDYYPVDFEVTPGSFMMEIAVYGLPVRMPHWSFGVRYIHQLVRQGMGHSHIYEVMFPGDPCHAYLMDSNSEAENALVSAHVLGHADFARNNQLFARFHRMAGGHIVEQAAAHAHAIAQAFRERGVDRVEPVLDAALALEPHIDVNLELHREPYPRQGGAPVAAREDAFQQRFRRLAGGTVAEPTAALREPPPPIPPRPEHDLLWFIAHYAPELEDWERDIFLAVRRESFYFFPIFACQIMNEGWASYWHARLLREADFLPQSLYLQAIKAHSDVVRPMAGDQQTALGVNPYHLGFSIWERIVAERGLDEARRIRNEEDDFGFIRNHLDGALAEQLGLFAYVARDNGEIRVASRDIHAIRENILAPKFNYGAPRVCVAELKPDGALVLQHRADEDGRGLDAVRASQVLEYIRTVWRRPVTLHTLDQDGRALALRAG